MLGGPDEDIDGKRLADTAPRFAEEVSRLGMLDECTSCNARGTLVKGDPKWWKVGPLRFPKRLLSTPFMNWTNGLSEEFEINGRSVDGPLVLGDGIEGVIDDESASVVPKKEF